VKITRAVANIIAGNQKAVFLGNLEAKRDWGFTPEYVECQWLILQRDMPDDYVIGTGESHTVREFVENAFSYAGIELEWRGEGVSEEGVIQSMNSASVPGSEKGLKVGDSVVKIDPKYFRPAEVDFLLADASRARKELGWVPKITFNELVKIMVDSDMETIGLNPPGEGKHILSNNKIDWTS
jgi:GDPmannose 4,6-dehydratase